MDSADRLVTRIAGLALGVGGAFMLPLEVARLDCFFPASDAAVDVPFGWVLLVPCAAERLTPCSRRAISGWANSRSHPWWRRRSRASARMPDLRLDVLRAAAPARAGLRLCVGVYRCHGALEKQLEGRRARFLPVARMKGCSVPVDSFWVWMGPSKLRRLFVGTEPQQRLGPVDPRSTGRGSGTARIPADRSTLW